MEGVKYPKDTAVRFWWEGQECTGIVERQERGFLFIRSNDLDLKWEALLGVRTGSVWLPGEDAPEWKEPAAPTGWPLNSGFQEGMESTAS